MSQTKKPRRVKPGLPKGFRDVTAADLRTEQAMLDAIRGVYDLYGFEPLETPGLEYTEALGKFLPDQDRPNAGVFSFRDEDEQWLSLRYDLTAPLARYVAENYDALPKPFRRYAFGPVWRNEKPGPGRFRQFMQFDADTVGAPGAAADAECCMLLADTLEALGLARGSYIVRLNNRKILDGVLETAGIPPGADGDSQKRLGVLRAIDKLDRLGIDGVRDLLGKGRKDRSGDYTKGAELTAAATDRVLQFLELKADNRAAMLAGLAGLVRGSDIGEQGVQELADIDALLTAAGYGLEQVVIDPSVVRGLEYYTGPVFEAELTAGSEGDDNGPRFGSVGSGGRYDGLVARFKGAEVPATGVSIGVSRLAAALATLNPSMVKPISGPVVVLVMDQGELARYQAMVQQLRAAGIRSEMYVGGSGMKAQMKYADKRGAPCVVIQGGDEIANSEIQVKDLIEGAKAAASIKDNKEWKAQRPAQFSVPEDKLVATVQDILKRHSGEPTNQV
jgi:histidyl-tRNA synthetase